MQNEEARSPIAPRLNVLPPANASLIIVINMSARPQAAFSTKNKHHYRLAIFRLFAATGISRWSFRCFEAHLPRSP